MRDRKLATRAFLPTNPTDRTNAEIILAVRRRLQVGYQQTLGRMIKR